MPQYGESKIFGGVTGNKIMYWNGRNWQDSPPPSRGSAAPPTAGVNQPITDPSTPTNSTTVTAFSACTAPTIVGETLASRLNIESFPAKLEESGSPYMLIKIFQTITGAAPITDPLTQSLLVGGEVTACVTNKIVSTVITDPENQAGLAAGVATGSVAIGALTALFGEEALGKINATLGTDIAKTFKEKLTQFNLKRNTQQLEHAIALFMPDGLNVNYDQEYEAISITQTLGLVGGLAQAIAQKEKGGGAKTIDPYIMEAASTAAGSILGDDFKRVGIFGTTGYAVNPQLELMYTSPTLRNFVFDFRLIPRSSDESETIKRILYLLKYYSAPRIPVNTTGRYFIPPAQFEIEFYNSPNTLNNFLFKTKKCALTSISVDHSPNGYATFKNGAPVETRLQLQFQETVILDRSAIDQEAGYSTTGTRVV